MTRCCKVCRKEFDPRLPMQSVCSPACALTLAQAKRAKAEKAEQVRQRKADREKREKLKSRREWLNECQVIANRYARIRDRDDGCISCERPSSWGGQWHGSHFRSVGAASAVRLNLWNINKACSICNHHLSGNIAGYTPRLIKKIGAKKVKWLHEQNHVVRYSIEYLKKYKRVIGKRLRRMKKRYEM